MAETLNHKHREFTRKLIKDTFMVLFEKKGIHKITVSEICKECEISRSAFYQHYDDKYSVLDDICEEILTHVQEINTDMHHIKIQDTDVSMPLWTETATYIYEQRNYIRPLICTPGDQQFIRKWRAIIRDTITKRLASDHYDQIANLDMITYTLASSILGLYEYWFLYKPELTPTEIAELGSQLLWRSFYSFQKIK